ncbi:MAG TPA: hypothetical protein VFQ36_12370 [Ktedonobacteraceae bacterium]|nr:hypothetical protein [Ktedonobacteraceae bacterium]
MEQGSEVARIMRQIDLEREAAQRGLSGFASTARHDFINARMQRGGERILRLIDEGKHEEAQALMNADNWGIEGRDNDEKGTRKRRDNDARREKRRRTNGKQGIKKG